MRDCTALVLAGGRGTRIASIHPDLPKPMVPVSGQPFLEWFVRRLVNQGVGEIILSIGHRADVIRSWAQKRQSLNGEYLICHEEFEALGTGGAVTHALPLIKTSKVLVLNGDTLFLAELAPAVKRMDKDRLNGIIFARPVDDASRYGSLEIKDGVLRSFREKQPGQGLINAGIYLFDTVWLRNRLKPGTASMETEILPGFLVEKARIGVVETSAPFIDIGTPETLKEADHFVAKHRELLA